MAAIGLIARIRRLSAQEWRDLVEAQLLLIVTQLRVWVVPCGRMVHVAEVAPDEPNTIEPDVSRVARTLSWVAAHGLFRPRCLVRALAMQAMLDRRGRLGSLVRIGARRGNDGAMHAHAWVMYRGRVIGDSVERTHEYVVIADARSRPAR